MAAASDWIDGPLARLRPSSPYGARLDLEADSLLTLGSAVAAVRHGSGTVVLVAPLARYAVASLRGPHPLGRDEIRWDRITGAAQMVVLGAALAPGTALRPLAGLAGPIAAARCAAVAAQVDRGLRARLNSGSTR